MKKVLFLMIAALSAGFASAVAVSWSNTQGVATSGQINRSTFGADKTFTFCLDNLSSSPNSIVTGDVLKSIVMVQSDSSANVGSYMKISDGTGNSYVSSAVASASSPTAITNNAGGTYTRTLLTYAFDQSIALDSSKTYTFQFYSDAAASTAAGTAFVITGAMDDGLSNTMYPSTYEVFMTINAEHTAVPEPTMLALIALGVAGLALKRRA